MTKLPMPKTSVLFKELPEGGVLYCSESEVYFGLNPVGVLIWESLPPVLHTVDDLLPHIIERFPDTDEDTARSDTLEFVGQLVENGLAAL